MPNDVFQHDEEQDDCVKDCVEDCASDDSDFANVFDGDNGTNSNSESACSNNSESAIEL